MKKRKRKRSKRLCPAHNIKLVYSPNKYGNHWHCPEEGCTVRCWGGKTSTPGDAETFRARNRAHAAFDPLWREKRMFQHRTDAYCWLREAMQMDAADCHIGMFTAEQCREVLRLIQDTFSETPT
jgi:hypothetical protein